MSSISIVPVNSGKQMRDFINFTLDLYKNEPNYVPELVMDTKSTLSKKTNPALEFCDYQPFLAVRDGKVVGRVVALINPVANEKWGHKEVRFGWIDFIEDYEVCKALLDAVVAWGKERGMTCMEGPMGFTDFDREGALVEGFDRFATMATIYNYPYYVEYYERYGLVKSVDWLEFRITVPKELPERVAKTIDIVKERYNLKVVKYHNIPYFKKHVAPVIFDLLNECYADLHGFSHLNEKQKQQYIDAYIPFVDLDILPMVYDSEGHLIGTALMIPSLAGAIKKAGGRLFPFGWWHLIKRLYLKKDEVVEFLLVAVKPEWQNKGLNVLMIADLFPVFKKKGFKYCETNCNLEDNHKVLSLWKSFEHENHKRRRAYRMDF
ncbi:MAG: N-acetyltransferase [Bacteroidales bacterium]|nr:N-acetyltransferase [Bacteroidales bacterium]